MLIEALVRGEVMTTAHVPDEDLVLEDADWLRAAQYREDVIRLSLMKLKLKLQAFFKPDVQVEYRLVFRSKLHLVDETESTDTALRDSDLPADDGSAPADPAAAG